MRLYNVALALGLAGLGILQQASSVKALTWDWSYNVPSGNRNGVQSYEQAAGTFTTAGTTFQSNTPYTITQVTGARNGITIAGLSPAGVAGQTFEWNGSNSSPLLLNKDGFAYILTNSSIVAASRDSGSFGAANTESYPPNPLSGTPTPSLALNIASSSLIPQTAIVPEPSEILGTFFFGTLTASYLVKRQTKKVTV